MKMHTTIRNVPMVPKKPLASTLSQPAVGGVKRGRAGSDVSTSKSIITTKTKKTRTGTNDENDDAASVASMGSICDIGVLEAANNASIDSVEGETRTEAIADATVSASSADTMKMGSTRVRILDGIPQMTTQDEKRYNGRARKTVYDEMLLEQYREKPKVLLCKKQSNIYFLEDFLRMLQASQDASSSVEIVERLRKADHDARTQKVEVAQTSAKVASHVAALAHKDKELKEKSQQIQELVKERDDLKRKFEEQLAANVQTAHKAAAADHLNEIERVKQACGAEAEAKSAAQRVEFEKELHALRAQVSKAQAEGSEALATAATQYRAKEAQLTAKIQSLQQEVMSLKQEITALKQSFAEAEAAVEEEKAAKTSALAAAAEEIAMWKSKFYACDTKRLALLDECVTLKGNIRVFARVRPALPGECGAETAATETPLFRFPDARDDTSTIEVVEKPGAGVGGYGVGTSKVYTFDLQRVFPPLSSQADVFKEVEGVVQAALNGHRACIFAYGQTGSGKTHTMQGGEGDARGIIPRSFEYIFERLAMMTEQGWTYQLNVEMLEIYNEELRDLSPGAAATTKHEIRHEKGQTAVSGLTSHEITSVEQVFSLLARAAENRSVGATNSNNVSSRSHSVFTMRLKLNHAKTSQSRSGILNLIDLAGSERIAKSGVNDTKAGGSEKLLKETQNINKSLSSLAQVIMALKNNQSHIPYRDSKLTYLLQHSLGGSCKTLMICNLNPLHSNTQESVCTLRFAKSVAEAGSATSGK